ncbi:MAG: acetylxylan esterase [Bacteroidota bacterium]|nr:acetylxylan esterase [Bacteroidota bacterium]
MKRIYLSVLLACIAVAMFAQTSDNQYRKPLKDVLKEVEQKFGITVRCPDDLLKDRIVNYAPWRFRTDAESTLTNILTPFDLKWQKEKDKQYKVKKYEYYRWTVEDGKANLNYLASLYNDKESWEKRKAEIRPCLWQAIKLSPIPAKPYSKPILTPIRSMDGYTVQNIAMEVLPGVYVCGSIYRPAKIKGKIPAMLCPTGHWFDARYRPDHQYQCAMLARLGVIAVSYDLFAWGESGLQFKYEDHQRSLSMTVQVLNTLRLLDYISAMKDVDTNRIGITGGSGGGSHTVLITALDDRIKLSVPVVSLSCYMYGGCPCESGMPIHLCAGETNNVEIAAMAAPRPQLVISDGSDWSDHLPEIEYPYLQRMYAFYGKPDLVKNVHLPNGKHDYNDTKRFPMYEFVAQHFNLDINKIKDKDGKIDESKVTIEKNPAMYVFGDKGEKLPANAIKGYDQLEKLFK